MESVFFARFPARALAAKFLHDIRDEGLRDKVEIKVIGNEQVSSAQGLPMALSNIRAAVVKGLLGGGIGGLVLGLIFYATGLVRSLGGGVFFGVVVGALAGMLGAGLIGSSDPDANLEKSVARNGPGDVVLSFESKDMKTDDELRQGVKRVGAEILQGAGPHPLDGPG